ncbi:MAG: ATP-binding protein [archaeon]|nr:ATP-binding protein [archaeon]
MISKFIDREEEISLLEEEWEKEKGRLIVLYGRRRIGKTRLLMEFSKTKNRNGILYIAEESSSLIQINGVKEKIAEFLNDPLLRTLEIKEWELLFGYLAKNMPEDRFYIILDEFSYLIRSDARVLGVLQKLWDTKFSSSSAFIVLSGSLLGLMSEKVLSYASPLYGRRTRDILLEGLSFKSAREFVRMPLEEALQLYLIIGGVPEYLLKASEYHNLDEFLEKEFLSKNGYFYREPYFIISQEFKELKTYFSILNAIAYGHTKPTGIANFTGIETRGIYPYLENLLRLGFIEREVSMFGSPKKGIYLIKDSIFDFWFNFVFKHREEIEAGGYRLSEGEKTIYLGKKFQSFVRDEFLRSLLPFRFEKIGRWWHKGEEIDIVAVNEREKQIAFFEVKWGRLSYQEAERILNALRDKAELVNWHVKGEERREYYGTVAASIEGKEELRRQGFLVYGIDELL